MAAPFPLSGENRVLGVSIGVVLSQGDDMPEALLLAADQAMYQAKDAGRGCYVLGRPAVVQARIVGSGIKAAGGLAGRREES
jgi:predicted signal transduction protein with EAL and GGDEF domain